VPREFREMKYGKKEEESCRNDDREQT